MQRPKRVLGYARVSSEDQARGTSLQDQQNAISAYAHSRGLIVTAFYVEAESATQEKIEKREQMRLLMANVRSGDLIICDKIDRWSRDPEFTYASLREIRACGASWYAVTDACDPSTAEGDTMLNFRILFAREEHKRIRQRMVGTRQKLRDAGYYVEGRTPYGYKRPKPPGFKGLEKNILVVVEEEAAKVRQMFRMCIAGKSLGAISGALDVDKHSVIHALKRRSYIGEIQDSQRNWIPGKVPAIISVETFQRAQEALRSRKYSGAKFRLGVVETSDWILRDIVICGLCGARLAAAYAGPQKKRRYYYRCRRACTTRYVNVRRAEALAEPMVIERLMELREEIAKGPEPVKRKAVDYEDLLSKLDKKRSRVLDVYADGLIGRDEMHARVSRIDEQRMKLEAQRQAAEKPHVLADASTRRELLREVKQLERAWARVTQTQKRGIVNLLASAFRLDAGSAPIPVWRTLAELAEEVLP